jgi:hypothetical protein
MEDDRWGGAGWDQTRATPFEDEDDDEDDSARDVDLVDGVAEPRTKCARVS